MHGPDWSDSDDSLFDDDGGYQEYKDSLRRVRSDTKQPPVLTEADIKQQNLEKLYLAISKGDNSLTLQLLENDVDVNSVLRDGYSPILLAACHGNPEMAKLLIEKGAKVNDSKDFTTALMMACSCPDYTAPFSKSLEVVKLLIEHGANVKAINRKRMNALMFACSTGNIDIVKYLVPLSDKTAVDNQRWNALFWAVSVNQPEIAKFLLEQGFDTSGVDVRGNDLLEVARIGDCDEILPLIRGNDKETNGEYVDVPDLSFEEHFKGLKKGQKPEFLTDIYNILNSVKCGHLFTTLVENNVTLDRFLSMNDLDLKNSGVLLPFQRRRILTGLYRFHKYPYHPKSLCIVPLDSIYSNVDVATQLMSAIKQIISMESSLEYILKQYTDNQTITNEQIKYQITNIRKKIAACKAVSKKLETKASQWDQIVKPVDLITESSIRSKIPWRKIVFAASIVSFIIMYRVCKERH